MRTKCLITCVNEVMVLGLKSLLNGQSDLEIVGVNTDREVELKGLVDSIQPDVLLMDRQNKFCPYLSSIFPMNQYPELFVVVLEIDQNLMQIYVKGESYFSNNPDILSVIRTRGGKNYEA